MTLNDRIERIDQKVSTLVFLLICVSILFFSWLLIMDYEISALNSFDSEWLEYIVSLDHRVDAVEQTLYPPKICQNQTVKSAIILTGVDGYNLNNASQTNIICQDGVDIVKSDDDKLLLKTNYSADPNIKFLCLTERNFINCSKSGEVS